MNIENLFSRRCSFCSSTEHDIRVCDSHLIPSIDHRLSEGFYMIKRQGEILGAREEDIKERFIVWAMELLYVNDLRVFAVTTIGSPATGYTKRQYAEDAYNIFKTLIPRVRQGVLLNRAMEEMNATHAEQANTNISTSVDISVNVNDDVSNNNNNSSNGGLVEEEEEITWSIVRTPSRDIEMMPLPSIRTSRTERIRERRARDTMNYIPSPQFVNVVRSLLYEMDMEADFIPFSDNSDSNVTKKFNIVATLETQAAASTATAVCECCICLNNEVNRSEIVKLNCEHLFCGECIITTLKKHNKSSEVKPCCALCRAPISQITVNDSEILTKFQELLS
jgi:hypothetical protein